MLVPGGPPTELGSALIVLRATVTRAAAYKDGHLAIVFGHGVWIRVPVSQTFEAWNVVGPGGLRVVSLPGGDLAVWKPEDVNS
jgi:hypothetical protein